jgi:hypothetical protein
MDPLNDLATFVLGRIKQGLYAQWLKFLFEMAFSAVVSFLVMCGGPLVAGARAGIAIGNGMIWAGMAMVYLFRRERSKLTAGMIVALPGDEAARAGRKFSNHSKNRQGEMIMAPSFKGFASKLVAAAKDFKAEILKAAAKAPIVAEDVEKDAPQVEALVELAFPGAAAVEQTALTAFEAICDAVKTAGPAAAANGLSVSLDKGLISSVQAALPALEAAASKL